MQLSQPSPYEHAHYTITTTNIPVEQVHAPTYYSIPKIQAIYRE